MRWTLTCLTVLVLSAHIQADEPLHVRIDALLGAAGKGKPVSPAADDAEFGRRLHLDLVGGIPTRAETQRFLADRSPTKRTLLVDQLLASPAHAVHMQERLNVMLMERLGEHPEWTKYLQASFQKNKPWDQMAREMLGGAAQDKDAAGAAFFLSKRLENFGQNPVDYPALTRDIGRLFLGKDLRCAQCHDHLTIKDYHQGDFQGLYAFVKNIALQQGALPSVLEKPTTDKIEFASVFGGAKMQTGPRVPGRPEIAIPAFKKGEEYQEKPDPKKKSPGVLKFSTLTRLAEEVPAGDNTAFSRNIANRLWFLMMGRGLVYPLDLHHSANPPTHPELLDLLAKELVAHKYDLRWLLRELALTQAYQRASKLPPGETEVKPGEYRTALERRLEPEQLLRSMLEATGENAVKDGAKLETLRPLFLKAFAYGPREPEDDFSPTMKGVLFLLNDKVVLGWLAPKPGNLLDRLQKIDADGKVAEELYLSVLSRPPSAEEARQVTEYLDRRRAQRPMALRNLAWALLASTEFCVNH